MNFSSQPGAHERHLKRAWQNPLFADTGVVVTQAALETAKMRDRIEAEQFLEAFHRLVEQVVTLDARVESDVMLDLKQQLDKSYEAASGLGGDMDDIKSAIRELLVVMMKAVRHGAGDDQQALMNLAEEDLARELHFELLEYPLVADLLRPESPVDSEALVPAILSEPQDSVPAVMSLFTTEQATELHARAAVLLGDLESREAIIESARNNLNIMARAAAARN